MGYIDGDALISGAILSFQQINRMKDNWRGAAAVSNPSAGMLRSDSSDEKLYHRQAAAWKEIVQWDTSPTLSGLLLPVGGAAATPTLAFGDGDTGLFESADDTLKVSVAGSNKMAFIGNTIATQVASFGYSLLCSAASATVPAHCFASDTDTGIGRAAADALSLIAGGVEGMRISEAGAAISIGVFSKVAAPATQPAAIADATGPGNIVDRCNDILAALRILGWIAT